MSDVRIVLADYLDPRHANALVRLLNAFASGQEGGGAPLTEAVQAALPSALAERPHAFSVLAFSEDTAVGLINCIEGFSTFACRPLVNVHDVVVDPAFRGRRVASGMLVRVEQEAVRRNACKLTLEVLQGNAAALRAYEREGFEPYRLDPTLGNAVFMQKKLTR
ncbi:MAG: GCN5-related N-acetyltransferase [Rhizobacter sp.]|nr:GCN5-related N-acetyltransferase [Rhizobacter sp.]